MNQTVILFWGVLDGKSRIDGPHPRAGEINYGYWPPEDRPVGLRAYDTEGNPYCEIRIERHGGGGPEDQAFRPSWIEPIVVDDWRWFRFKAEHPASGELVDTYYRSGGVAGQPEYRWPNQYKQLSLFSWPLFVIPFKDGELFMFMSPVNEGAEILDGGPNRRRLVFYPYRASAHSSSLWPLRYLRRCRRYGLDGYERDPPKQIYYQPECVEKDPDEQHFYIGGFFKTDPYWWAVNHALGLPHPSDPISQYWTRKHGDNPWMGDAIIRKYDRDGNEIWNVPGQTEMGWEGVLGLHIHDGFLWALQVRGDVNNGGLSLLKIDRETGSVLSEEVFQNEFAWEGQYQAPWVPLWSMAVAWGPVGVYVFAYEWATHIKYAGGGIAKEMSINQTPWDPLYGGFRWREWSRNAWVQDGHVYAYSEIEYPGQGNWRVFDEETFEPVAWKYLDQGGFTGSNVSAVDPETQLVYQGRHRERTNYQCIDPQWSGSGSWGYYLHHFQVHEPDPQGDTYQVWHTGNTWSMKSATRGWPGGNTNKHRPVIAPPYSCLNDYYDEVMSYTDDYGRMRGPDFGGQEFWLTVGVAVLNDLEQQPVPIPYKIQPPEIIGDKYVSVPGVGLGGGVGVPELEIRYVGRFRPEHYRVLVGGLVLVPSLILGREREGELSLSLVIRAPSDSVLVQLLASRGQPMRIERAPAGIPWVHMFTVPLADIRYDRGVRNASVTLSGSKVPELRRSRFWELSSGVSLSGNNIEIGEVNPYLRIGDHVSIGASSVLGPDISLSFEVEEITWSIGPQRAFAILLPKDPANG